MKCSLFFILMMLAGLAQAEVPCDVRVGRSVGLKVVEFATGNIVHSKMSLRESSPEAIKEEMINLQDEGLCEEKIIAKKCVLKLEKKARTLVTLYRGKDRWLSWFVEAKRQAQDFVLRLKRAGFCS